MRVTRDFLRGRGRSAMTEEEKDVLDGAVERIEEIPARTIVIRRGELIGYSTMLLDGAMCRYMDARDGLRQLVAMQVTGDFVDLHGYPLQRLDHDVGTLTDVRVALVPHARIDRILVDHPRLTRLMWRSTLLDAALHREWIFRIGRLDAAGRLAHFLLETYHRLRVVGRADGGAFELALTQQDLGEALGLTSVHVNRMLQQARRDGDLQWRVGHVRLTDPAGLARKVGHVPVRVTAG